MAEPIGIRSIESYAARQFGVVSAEQAALCGYGKRERERLCERGIWWRPQRGIYAPQRAPDESDEAGRHLLRIAAALVVVDDEKVVVADVSAAMLWGLEWAETPPLTTVHLARPAGKDRVLPGIRIHRVALPELHVLPAPNGMPALSPARLIVDFARKLGLRPVLIMADAALRTGLTTKAEIAIVLEHCRRWPGAAQAARHLARIDRRAGSAAESLARAVFIELGLTGFELQYVIKFPDGGKAEVDICFPGLRLVFEVDGKLKYADSDAHWKEKKREDRIRDRDYHVVRLTWTDLTADHAVLKSKIDEGFRRAELRLRACGGA